MTASTYSQNANKTYILVHGAFHGAWCWYKIIPLLEGKGHKVLALDLPGSGKDTTDPTGVTLSDCVNKVVTIAEELTEKVILVGHSSGGIVISQVAEKLGSEKVDKLIYLDAFLPKNGESVWSLVEMVQKQLSFSSVPELNMIDCIISSEDGTTATFKPEFVQQFFYHDCSAEDTNFAKANLSRQAFAPLGTQVILSDCIYGAIPKYYILCTKSKDLDKTFLSTHVSCKKVFTLPSSHSPFFSMPEKLVKILEEMYRTDVNLTTQNRNFQ